MSQVKMSVPQAGRQAGRKKVPGGTSRVREFTISEIACKPLVPRSQSTGCFSVPGRC